MSEEKESVKKDPRDEMELEGISADFNFTKEIHGYNGNVGFINEIETEGDIYLSNVKFMNNICTK